MFEFVSIQCLSHMSVSLPPVDLYNNKPPAASSRLQTEHPDDDKSSQSLYGSDMDSVDIAVRSALVKFFCSPNVLANFTKHTRVLRLYPRPVVAFLKDVFISSRNEESSYIRALVETQVKSRFSHLAFTQIGIFQKRNLYPALSWILIFQGNEPPRYSYLQ